MRMDWMCFVAFLLVTDEGEGRPLRADGGAAREALGRDRAPLRQWLR